MTSTTEPTRTTVQVQTRGGIALDDATYAQEKVAAVLRFAGGTVLRAQVRVTRLPVPRFARPFVAQATIDVNGRTVQARASRPTYTEAVDELQDRLRERLVRASGRRHR